MMEGSKTTGTSEISGETLEIKQTKKGEIMKFKGFSFICTIAVLVMSAIMLTLSGCGGGGGGSGLSTEVVSGVAAVGAALSGQVSLKDSSTTPKEKVVVIGSDGSFAIDVTGMQPPYILRANGTAAGTAYKLHSFASGSGIANINPLSDAVVAGAAEVDDPSDPYDKPDRDKFDRISKNLSKAVSTILNKLQPLLLRYNAENTNPITSRYIANHLGLDEMFDNVKITVSGGILTIIYTKTGAVIFSGSVTDIANGIFNSGNLPPLPSPPAAPTGLTAVGGAGQVSLSWTSVGNATSYNLYYSNSTGVTTVNGTKITGAVNPYTHTGLAAGTTYYYIVTAVNSNGESAASAQASASTNVVPPTPTVPTAPTGVTATGGTKQVTVSWPTVSGATSYNLYWSLTTGVTTSTGTKITGAVSPAVHSGLSDSTNYYYIVTAVNSTGESAASVQVAATTITPTPTPTVPAAPGGVSAVGGTNQTTVSWSAVAGATSYNIYWSTTTGAGVGGTKLAGVTSPYVHTGRAAGTTYYYVVTAINLVGESTASTQASATTSAAPPALPAAPTGVSAVGGSKQVTVSWSTVSGATSYNIFWSNVSGVTTATGTKITGATSPYLHMGLADGTAYYYIVAAANVSGQGPASTQVTATTTAAPPVFDALAFYNNDCLGCHGTLGPRTAAQITTAIAGIGSMSRYRSTGASPLTAAQIAAIAAVSY